MKTDVQLTERQQQILEIICTGKQQKEAADELGISVKTVDTTIQRIKTKIKVNNVQELCVYYFSKRFNIPVAEIMKRSFTIILLCILFAQQVISFDTVAARRARRGRSRRNDVELIDDQDDE